MRAGRIANTQIILNNWFLVMIALFAMVGMAAKVFFVFSSVLWHEMAHALTARFLGLKVREIEILPFGGVARIDGLSEAGARKEAIIAAVGPLSSLLLAALALPAVHSPHWGDIARFYVEVNATLAVFNMLPALPLDGGRIVRAWMTIFLSYHQATQLMGSLTKIITVLMLVFVATRFMIDGTLYISLIFAAVFLYAAARSEVKLIRYRVMNLLAQKKASLTARGVMPTAHFTALGTAMARDVVDLFSPDHYGIILVLDEGCRPRGSLTETEVWEGLPERGANATIDEFLNR